MPKVVDARKRKQEIVRTAVSVFASIGYDAANLSDISARLGFARTTIYKYFKNKEEILDGAIDDVFSRFDASADAACSDLSGALARLETVMDAWFKAFLEDPDGSALALDVLIGHGRQGHRSERARERVVAMRDRLRGILAEGLESGELSGIDPTAMAYLAFSIVQSFSIQAALFGNTEDSAYRSALKLMLSACARGT
jgi:AcrR family transcriptional regulator